MRFPDLLRLATRNSLRNGVKALLCAGAVCISICSICTVRGVGTTAERMIGDELNAIGVSGLVFYAANGPAISEEAVSAVCAVEDVSAAMPLEYRSGSMKLRNYRAGAAVCGVEQNLSAVLSVQLLYGRLPGRGEYASGARVAILDEQTALGVYRRANIVGKPITLTVNGTAAVFEIIGIISSQKQGLETLLGGKLPCIVYVPYLALDAFAGEGGSEMVAVAPKPGTDEAILAQKVARALKYTLSAEYSYENLDRYASSFRTITKTVSTAISGIAAISILVGGIGVMNSMVAVVDERVGEIGVWLALGARRRSIAGCYLLEALLVCLTGGLAGVALSYGVLLLLKALTRITLLLRIQDMLLGIAGAACCGMLFGLLPAMRAARMNPINAIRSE